MTSPLRVLELFAGIGGCAAALHGRAEIVAAVDIDARALAVYRHNWPHPTFVRTIESLPASQYRAWGADLWWHSPPCQPFTIRGRRRDLDDPRTQPLLAVIERIDELRPTWVALENVPGFAGSQAHGRLCERLSRAGYTWQETERCPTELGIPNRRRRYYLVAGLEPLLPGPRPGKSIAAPRRPLREFLDVDPPPGCAVAPELLARYANAIDRVDPADDGATASCFTSAYGHSPIRSGSYLKMTNGGTDPSWRRFSPAEIARLLGFPPEFAFLPNTPLRTAYSLLGASLSISVVRQVLDSIPALRAEVMPARV